MFLGDMLLPFAFRHLTLKTIGRQCWHMQNVPDKCKQSGFTCGQGICIVASQMPDDSLGYQHQAGDMSTRASACKLKSSKDVLYTRACLSLQGICMNGGLHYS